MIHYLPKRVRHWIVCRWQYALQGSCHGHGPGWETFYGEPMSRISFARQRKRPRLRARLIPKKAHHWYVCKRKHGWTTFCAGHGRHLVRYHDRPSIHVGLLA